MGPAAPIIGLVFSAVAAVGALKAGAAAQEQAEIERAQIQDQTETARIQALQDVNARERAFRQTISAGRVSSAARTGGILGGSIRAFETEVEAARDEDVLSIRVGALSQARQYGLAARAAKRRGKNARTQSFFKAAGIIGKAGLDFDDAGGFGGDEVKVDPNAGPSPPRSSIMQRRPRW
jgi:hypothetical protein